MLQTLSNIKVIDNSGGKEGHCIRILRGKKSASIGDTIVVSLRKITKLPKKAGLKVRKVSLGKIYRMFVLQTKKEVIRSNGSYIKFTNNAGILLNKQNQPIGNRIKGLFPLELRDSTYLKTMSLGPNLI